RGRDPLLHAPHGAGHGPRRVARGGARELRRRRGLAGRDPARRAALARGARQVLERRPGQGRPLASAQEPPPPLAEPRKAPRRLGRDDLARVARAAGADAARAGGELARVKKTIVRERTEPLREPSREGLHHVGHATHWIVLEGVRILTDPWLSEPADRTL